MPPPICGNDGGVVVAFAFQARIEGVEALQKMLKQFTLACQRRILRPALNNEGTKVLKAARRNINPDTGLLRKSLGKKTKTYPDGGVVVIVGPRYGFKQVIKGKGKNPVNYMHLVEFGARPHFLKGVAGKLQGSMRGRRGRWVKTYSNRHYTKHMHPGAPAQRPLKRAAESALVGAAQRMANRMAIEIEKLAAKGKLKTGS